MEPSESTVPTYSSTVDQKTSNKKLVYLLIIGIFIVLAIGISSYFYIQYSNTKKLLNKEQTSSKEDVSKTIQQVGKLIELPDETPTVATVSDVEKLKSQAFFSKAQNGDKVLIFTDSKKAILYRPSTKKIIEVSALNIGDSPTSAAIAPTAARTGAKTTPTTPKVRGN